MKPAARHILLSLFSAATACYAVTNPVAIQRACLDRTTKIVTVYFKPGTDPCNSFTSYELWGRDNASNPFNRLAVLASLNATQITANLGNLKKWELFVCTKYACNGTDTLNSDTIYIDDQPPAYIEPDSVSVDWATQQLRAGWTRAPEPDVMGYSIFKVDATSGNNILLDEQNVLTYLFPTSTFNTSNSGNRVAIAAYDSCRNGGIISNYHSPVLLKFNTGQNANYKCTRKLYIDWSAYVGWPVASYDVWVFNSRTATWNLDGTVGGGTLTYIYTIPWLGESYAFIIRAHKTGGSISSSSNRIDISLGDFVHPSYYGIGHVSVRDASSAEITAAWENTLDVSKVILQTRTHNSGPWADLSFPVPATGSLTYIHNNLNTALDLRDYRLVILNGCGFGMDTSLVHTNIRLSKSAFTLSWNEYYGWIQKSYSANPYVRKKQSSTWNNLVAWPDSTLILTDTSKAECFRVLALQTGINGKTIDSAWSNEICLRVFDTTLIPGGFSPGGINPIFKIINPNIEPGQAKMLIFNRWGEKIFEGDALTGWDGTDPKGDLVGPGIYPYLITIFRPEKRETFKGVITAIR